MITINYQRYGNRTFQLRLRLYQDGESKYIAVTKLLKGNIQKRHWNPGKQQFIPSCPFSEENNKILGEFRHKYDMAALHWSGSLHGFMESLQNTEVKSTPTISEFIKEQAKIAYNRLHQDGSRKGTSYNYLKLDMRLRDFCEFKRIKYDKILITELTPTFVDNLFEWIANHKKGKGKSYISKDLHTMITFADKEGYLSAEEFKKCDWYKKPRMSSKKYHTLSEEQIIKFYETDFLPVTRVKRSRLFKDVCLVMLYTGQSPCDTLTMKQSQIQKIEGVSHIVFKRRKLDHRQAVPCSVPMNKNLLEIVKYWSKRGKDGYIFPIRRMNIPTTKETLRGDLIAFTKHMNVWLKKVGEYLGCSFPLHSYAFRHTAITRYVSKNIPVVYLSNMFGTSVDNIEKIYYNNQGDTVSRNKVMEAMSI